MHIKVKTCVRGCSLYSDFFERAVGMKHLTRIIFIIYRIFGIYSQGDQTCGLTFDGMTFILMLFADDMIILGKEKDDWQTTFDLLETYSHEWGLQVNTDKTNIVVFRKRGAVKWWTMDI